MIVWQLKACLRCGGDLFVENNSNGWYKQCLQCAYQRDLEAEPAFRWRSRFGRVRSGRELVSVGSR